MRVSGSTSVRQRECVNAFERERERERERKSEREREREKERDWRRRLALDLSLPVCRKFLVSTSAGKFNLVG